MYDVQELKRLHPGSVLVDADTIRKGVLFKNVKFLKNSNSWHAFILHNVLNVERNYILKIVMDHIYPLDLIPVKFESEGEDCMFMARNCKDAIEKLCKDNLLIPNPDDSNLPLKCTILLNFSTLHKLKVDVQKNISTVLSTLFNPSTKCLNLDNFSANEGLTEFCPLSQPKIMYFVLHIALGMYPTTIKLTNNSIHSLFPMEAVWSSNTLKNLDLRNNKIDEESSLYSLHMLKLTDLWLDGNPICNIYDEYSYVTKIREILPSLERLDGILLLKNGFPASTKNSLCNPSGFDITDQFIEYYFPLYDTDRKQLESLYHPNAMCSMTNEYKNNQLSSSTARLRPYQVNSRNILAIADFSRSQQFLIKGNSSIIRKLVELPRTEHDPFSFKVDLMHYSETCAVISISGVFRELPESLLDQERQVGFFRTFVLTGSNGEFVIANDMLHVYNALNYQTLNSFLVTKPIKRRTLPLPTSIRDKAKAIEAVHATTGVSKEWSKKFLEEANYNVVECLKTFVELFKVDRIPQEAFDN